MIGRARARQSACRLPQGPFASHAAPRQRGLCWPGLRQVALVPRVPGAQPCHEELTQGNESPLIQSCMSSPPPLRAQLSLPTNRPLAPAQRLPESSELLNLSKPSKSLFHFIGQRCT